MVRIYSVNQDLFTEDDLILRQQPKNKFFTLKYKETFADKPYVPSANEKRDLSKLQERATNQMPLFDEE